MHTNTTFPVATLRRDFPALDQMIHGYPLIYFDNAATTQKPRQVIQAVVEHYQYNNANVHRALHTLSDRATRAFEQARTVVAQLINAASTQEIIFTKGTTEAINLVAQCFGHTFLKPGDEILITTMEHHANIVPWQVLGEQLGCHLRVAPLTPLGEIDQTAFAQLLSERTKIVALPHISNVLGTLNPVAQLIQTIRQLSPAVVLLDGAQAIAHENVDVCALDCDFYVFSGHKLYAPSGVGVLYGKAEWLEKMPPYQTGGEMIRTVTFAHTDYNDLPYKFEAGTPNMEGVVGLQAAIGYLHTVGIHNIRAYEQQLLQYGTTQLGSIPGLRLLGTAPHKSAIFTFVCAGISPHDLGTLLDLSGIAVRVGHHCAMPLLASLNLSATLRASLAFYNTVEEIDLFIAALQKAIRILRG